MSYEPSFQAGDFDGQDFDTGEIPIVEEAAPVPSVKVSKYVYRPTGTYELSTNKIGRPRFSYARLRAKLGLT